MVRGEPENTCSSIGTGMGKKDKKTPPASEDGKSKGGGGAAGLLARAKEKAAKHGNIGECREFKSKGACSRGDDCRFSHGDLAGTRTTSCFGASAMFMCYKLTICVPICSWG